MTAKECIKERRSIRSFKPDAVSPELIRELVETASYSPSWKNTQIVRYVAVTGETKARIANECTDNWKKNAEGGCLCQWELKAPTDSSQSDCVHEQVAKADGECPLYIVKNTLKKYLI